MQTCGNCNSQAADEARTCPRCGAELTTTSYNALALARLQSNDRVSKIRISVMDTCCPACASVQGAYAKELVPALPTEGCSHALGCRCHYEPVLTEIYP